MTPREVEQTRERILDTALEIIIQEGFENLSLRKIASRLGVTPTTLYNYYSNKDELNLMIRVRGFEKLFDLMTKQAKPHTDIEPRFKAMLRGYVEFGLTYPSYYDIMFNLHTPKYLDYMGTDIEPLAHHEKQNALKCLALFIEPLNAYIPGNGLKKDRFVLYQVVKFWSDLHGLITLHNSRLFHEVLDDVDSFIKQRTTDLIDTLLQFKQRIDAGETLF
ncbi:MAG: TetR/AcrR family transcriptional regulator [Thermodesulfobacteriota bacterium]